MVVVTEWWNNLIKSMPTKQKRQLRYSSLIALCAKRRGSIPRPQVLLWGLFCLMNSTLVVKWILLTCSHHPKASSSGLWFTSAILQSLSSLGLCPPRELQKLLFNCWTSSFYLVLQPFCSVIMAQNSQPLSSTSSKRCGLSLQWFMGSLDIHRARVL